jgi:hypothetical protein
MEAFQAQAAHAGHLAPCQKALLFTGGLPDHISIDVELQEPQDLQSAMYLARAYERRNAPAQLALPVPPQRTPRRAPRQQPALLAPTAPAPALAGTAAARARPFKRLSPEEMALRRKQGLCYNCDEPYARGHKCARLFYLEVADYIVEEPDDAAGTPTTEQAAFDPDAPMISCATITGIRIEETMQLHVRVGKQTLTDLLDSGSTHNFISTAAAARVGLQFGDSKGAHVVVANGDRVACRGLTSDVAVQIGAESFQVDLYSIPLECYDMVLGIAFLRTLGPVL